MGQHSAGERLLFGFPNNPNTLVFRDRLFIPGKSCLGEPSLDRHAGYLF
jgi:hypothetical protein